MEYWLSANWFSVVQTIGIIGGYVFTARSARRDDLSRQISNLFAVNERYFVIWQEFFRQPKLSRVFKNDIDLGHEPVNSEEQHFVKMLILHLDTVRRAMNAGVFVKIEGIKEDIREFMSFPIPKAVWEKIKPFQDGDFVAFVENCSEEK